MGPPEWLRGRSCLGASKVLWKNSLRILTLLRKIAGPLPDWVIVDEAARLKPAIWEGHVSQRLIDKKGWALLISTPRGKGWLYELFRRGQSDDPDYESWNSPSHENPYLERVFRQEYCGEFLEGSGAVFRNVRECATGEFADPIPGQRYYAGLDLAKVEDFTVLVILNREKEVVFLDRYNRIDWALQVNRVQAAVERYNKAAIFVDSTGAGEPVFESLRNAGCRVEPYPFTQKSKAALVDCLSMLLEQRAITLPKPSLAPELIDELEAFEYSVTDSGSVRTGAPFGVHDDCTIGLALAAWHFRPKPRNLVRVVKVFG